MEFHLGNLLPIFAIYVLMLRSLCSFQNVPIVTYRLRSIAIDETLARLVYLTDLRDKHLRCCNRRRVHT